jgi:hypothetical protein
MTKSGCRSDAIADGHRPAVRAGGALVAGMSEHVMVKDLERHKLLCGKCGVPWPCGPKQQEILADIKQREAQKR